MCCATYAYIQVDYTLSVFGPSCTESLKAERYITIPYHFSGQITSNVSSCTSISSLGVSGMACTCMTSVALLILHCPTCTLKPQKMFHWTSQLKNAALCQGQCSCVLRHPEASPYVLRCISQYIIYSIYMYGQILPSSMHIGGMYVRNTDTRPVLPIVLLTLTS